MSGSYHPIYVPPGEYSRVAVAALIGGQLAEQGHPTSPEALDSMAEGILDYRATHPEGRCTETCGCLTTEELLAKLDREGIP